MMTATTQYEVHFPSSVFDEQLEKLTEKLMSKPLDHFDLFIIYTEEDSKLYGQPIGSWCWKFKYREMEPWELEWNKSFFNGCEPMEGVQDCRFIMSEEGVVISEQFRKKDANGEYVYAGDLIVFDEGDFIPEEVYIADDYHRLAVDSYHAFHLLDELTSFCKYKKEE